MLSAKTEITLKINELPTKVKVSGQSSTFDVSDGNITYSITCKTKSLNKVTKTIQGFKNPFVIAIAGKQFSNVNKGLIAIEQCGLQVFEKIPKELKENTEDSEGT